MTVTHDGSTQQAPLRYFIEGVPVQQGSKTAFVRGNRAVVTDQNAKKLKPWRAHVKEVTEAAAARHEQFVGALGVTLVFFMPRGATVKRARPSVTPDIDKLTRAVLDGITDSGAWKDDALVVSLHASEWYADAQIPGVQVEIWAVELL